MGFYSNYPDSALRFGDVVQGFVFATVKLYEPFPADTDGTHFLDDSGYSVDISLPRFSVVMSPSCSIGERMVSLAPLLKVKHKFFENEYYAENLTNINRIMQPQQALPRHAWENKLTPKEREEKMSQGNVYALVELFVYERHDLFPPYTLKENKKAEITTNYYMIDFRSIQYINCSSVASAENSPLKSKVLQLSDDTRRELWDKLINYYTRESQAAPSSVK